MINRITVHTPLGDDALLFWSLTGTEQLSSPYAFQLKLLSQDFRIDRKALLGKPLTVEIPLLEQTASRYLNGKITAVSVESEEISGTRYAVYQLCIEPDIWPMSRDQNLRIFQNQNVPTIIKTLLSEYGVTVEDNLEGTYRDWEYCVQYQESSLNFIHRLMELEGIHYFFRHQMGQHTLILGDSAKSHQPFDGYATIPYHLTASGGTTSEEGISQWSISDIAMPGIYSIDDYDFRKPHAWLFQARQNPVSPQPGKIDVYDWPGHFVDTDHGASYARIRQEAWQVAQEQINGSATALGIAPGHTFTLYNAPFGSDNGNYLVQQVTYQLQENRYASGDNQGTLHQLNFTVIPADVVFRATPKASWPKTYGPQTASVVGPADESIWTDKYGRIKVKFRWDRVTTRDDTSSCWVRVSSAWAGQGYGGVQIPRIGDEVVIDFINGDPDRPIVIGRVYNDANMPPWQLPESATQMGFLSRSKDGTTANANALRFEDKAGQEQVWLHAERNLDTDVEQNESHAVGGDRSKTISGNETGHIKKNRSKSVDGNENVTIAQDRTKTISGNETVTIAKNHSEIITGNDTLTIKQNHDETVEGNRTSTLNSDHTVQVKGKQTLTVDGDRIHTVKANENITVMQNRTLQVTGDQAATITGKETYSVTKNQNVTVGSARTITIAGDDARTTHGKVEDRAAKSFLLAVGSSTIEISPGKIEINAGGASIVVNALGVSVDGKKISLNA